MKVYVGGARVDIDPARSLGAGGEADVYDMGGGMALKLFKGPRHPDFAGQPAAQRQVALRLDEHQNKLSVFPAGLPERVVVPEELARRRARGGRVVGYTMRKIDGAEPLYRFADPRFRRTRASSGVAVAALRDLRTTVAAVHDAGVVIGDFNDLNVLVQNTRAYVIDADSFQFGSYPCRMFTDRFVDPLRCIDGELPLQLAAPHNRDSDWYAFAVMAFRTLLCVDPFGGVHRPAKGRGLTPGHRRLGRIWVLDPDVTYPKPAVPADSLPDDVLGYFEAVFCRDQRAPIESDMLESLRWTRCISCNREHARLLCPSCTSGRRSSERARVMVRGSVTAECVLRAEGVVVDARIHDGELSWLTWDGARLANQRGVSLCTVGPAPGRSIRVCGDGAILVEGPSVRSYGRESAAPAGLADVVPQADAGASVAVSGDRVFRVVAGALVKEGTFGEETVGHGLAGQTRIWVGDRMGVGWYRAGAITVAMVFDTERRGVTEVMNLPPARGQLVSATCAVGAERAWLTTVEQIGGRELARCVLLDATGRVLALAEAPLDACPWLASAAGACAVGPQLFVPTDDGIVRVENDGGQLEVTRGFPDTAPFVDAASRLLAGRDGLHVVSRSSILRLALS